MNQNQIFKGNSIKILNELKEESIDLVITSPPYDNLRGYDGLNWNFEIFKDIAKGLYRVVKQGGVIVWIVNDATLKGSETGTSFRHALYFKELGFNIHDTMIWLKDSSTYPSGYRSVRYTSIFEYMFIFSKGKPKSINLIKDKPNKYHDIKKNNWSQNYIKGGFDIRKSVKKEYSVNKFGMRYNVWKNTSARYEEKVALKHPAVFPENLIKDHMITWSKEGDVVLDCFAGSGTTLKVADQNNRKFIGIEINEKYVDIIKERLDKHNIKYKLN